MTLVKINSCKGFIISLRLRQYLIAIVGKSSNFKVDELKPQYFQWG